jgi:hypothetical protein
MKWRKAKMKMAAAASWRNGEKRSKMARKITAAGMAWHQRNIMANGSMGKQAYHQQKQHGVMAKA